MQQRFLVVLGVFLVASVCVQQINAYCDVCQTNNITCMSETQYYFCKDGVKVTGTGLISCPTGSVCTDKAVKCISGIPSTCLPPTNNCNKCDATKMFTCTSPTAFAQCNGTTPMSTITECPSNHVCKAAPGQPICVINCNLGKPDCP